MKSGRANRCGFSWSPILLGSSLLLALGSSWGCTQGAKCRQGSQNELAQSPECGAANKESQGSLAPAAGQGTTPAATSEECARRDPANCGPGCMSATGTRYDLAKACTYAPAPAGCFAPQLATIPGSPEPQVACDGATRLLTSPKGHTFLFPSGCAPGWPTTLVDNATVMQIFSSKTSCTP